MCDEKKLHKTPPFCAAFLFDIINYTCTSMGKRYLNFNICNPLCDVDILNDRYEKISELNVKNIDLSDKLKKILDIERLHRKISLQNLNPHNFIDLHTINYRKKS